MQFDPDDEEINELIQDLIDEGYIEPVGFSDSGEVLYKTNEKFKNDFPEMFAEQVAETNKIMYELWVLGLVDITVKEDINDWVVYPNNKTFSCDTEQLTPEQKNIIMQLRYRTVKPEDDTI